MNRQTGQFVSTVHAITSGEEILLAAFCGKRRGQLTQIIWDREIGDARRAVSAQASFRHWYFHGWGAGWWETTPSGEGGGERSRCRHAERDTGFGLDDAAAIAGPVQMLASYRQLRHQTVRIQGNAGVSLSFYPCAP